MSKQKVAPPRPLVARRLPWHGDGWRRLNEQRRAGRLPHALLLRGPAGIGKAEFGAFLANAMLCSEPRDGGEACGRCRACVQFRAGSHPDYRVGEPEEGKKIIRVEQVRAWIDWLVQRPHYQGGVKVLLVPEAERMNPSSANALLKTLEEPPGDTLIILVTARPASLLATVRSRCQALVLPMPERTPALTWVNTEAKAEQLRGGDPEDALAFCGGAPLAALQALRDDQVQPYQELLRDLAGIATGGKDPVAVARQWFKKDLEWLINWMLGSVQAMISNTANANANAGGSSGGRQTDRLSPELQQIAAGQSPPVLFGHLDRLTKALGQLHAGQNPNAQLLLESLFIPWQPRPGRRPS